LKKVPPPQNAAVARYIAIPIRHNMNIQCRPKKVSN